MAENRFSKQHLKMPYFNLYIVSYN